MSVSTDDHEGQETGFFDGVCDVIGLTPCENWQDDRHLSPTESRFSEPSRHQVPRQHRKGSRVDTSASSIESRHSSSVSHGEDADKYYVGCTIPSMKAAATKLRNMSFDRRLHCSMPKLSTRDVVGPLVACARRRDSAKTFRLDQLQRQRIRELEQMNIALRSRLDELERETNSGNGSKQSQASKSHTVNNIDSKIRSRDVVDESLGPVSHILISKEAKSLTARAKVLSAVQKKDEKRIETDGLMQELEDLKKIVESQRYVQQQLDDLRESYRLAQTKNRALEAERQILGESLKSLDSKHRTLQRKLYITEERHRTKAKLADLIDRENVTKAILLDHKHEIHNLKCEIAMERIMKRRYKYELEALRVLHGQLDHRADDLRPILLSEQIMVDQLRQDNMKLRQENGMIARKFQSNVNSIAKHYWKEESILRDEIEALEIQFVEIARGVASGSKSAIENLAAIENRLTHGANKSGSDCVVDIDNPGEAKDCEQEDSEDELSMGPAMDPNHEDKLVADANSGRRNYEDKLSDRSYFTGKPTDSCSSGEISLVDNFSHDVVCTLFDSPENKSADGDKIFNQSNGATEAKTIPMVPILSDTDAKSPSLDEQLPVFVDSDVLQHCAVEQSYINHSTKDTLDISTDNPEYERIVDEVEQNPASIPPHVIKSISFDGRVSPNWDKEELVSNHVSRDCLNTETHGEDIQISIKGKKFGHGTCPEDFAALSNSQPWADHVNRECASRETHGADVEISSDSVVSIALGTGVEEESTPFARTLHLYDNTYSICAVVELVDRTEHCEEKAITCRAETSDDHSSAPSATPYVGDIEDIGYTGAKDLLPTTTYLTSPGQSVDGDDSQPSVEEREIPSSVTMQSDSSVPGCMVSNYNDALKLLSAAANSFLCSPTVETDVPPTRSNDDATIEQELPPPQQNKENSPIGHNDGVPTVENADTHIENDVPCTVNDDDASIESGLSSVLSLDDVQAEIDQSPIPPNDGAPTRIRDVTPMGKEQVTATLAKYDVPQPTVNRDFPLTNANADASLSPCKESCDRWNHHPFDESSSHSDHQPDINTVIDGAIETVSSQVGCDETSKSINRTETTEASVVDTVNSTIHFMQLGSIETQVVELGNPKWLTTRYGTIQNQCTITKSVERKGTRSNEHAKRKVIEPLLTQSGDVVESKATFGPFTAAEASNNTQEQPIKFFERRDCAVSRTDPISSLDDEANLCQPFEDIHIEYKPISDPFQRLDQSQHFRHRIAVNETYQNDHLLGKGALHGEYSEYDRKVKGSATNDRHGVREKLVGLSIKGDEASKSVQSGNECTSPDTGSRKSDLVLLADTQRPRISALVPDSISMDAEELPVMANNMDWVGRNYKAAIPNHVANVSSTIETVKVDMEQLFRFPPASVAKTCATQIIARQPSTDDLLQLSPQLAMPAITRKHSSDSDLIRLDSVSQSSGLEPDFFAIRVSNGATRSHSFTGDTVGMEKLSTDDLFWGFSLDAPCKTSEPVDLLNSFLDSDGPSTRYFEREVRIESYKPLPSFFKSTSADHIDFFPDPMNVHDNTIPECNRTDAESYQITRSPPKVSLIPAAEQISSHEQLKKTGVCSMVGATPVVGETGKNELDQATRAFCSEDQLLEDWSKNTLSGNPVPSLEETTLGDNPSRDDNVPFCGDVAEHPPSCDDERSNISNNIELSDWDPSKECGVDSVALRRNKVDFDIAHASLAERKDSNAVAAWNDNDTSSLVSLPEKPPTNPAPLEKNWIGNVVQGIVSLWL